MLEIGECEIIIYASYFPPVMTLSFTLTSFLVDKFRISIDSTNIEETQLHVVLYISLTNSN